MIKIPFINQFMTDDQEFYDAQINEELKYCNSSNYTIRFTDLGKNRRAFVIKTKEGQTIVLIFMKTDYKGINQALEKMRLNLALAEKENLTDSSEIFNITLGTSSKEDVVVEGNDGEKCTLTISTVDELLINNNSLRKREDVIKRLFDLSLQNDRQEPYLDFPRAGYDRGIQNYLIMNLYNESINLDDTLVDILGYYKLKDPKIYYLVNSFLRGNFDEMFNYSNSLEHPISVTSIAKICQGIIQIQEQLPNRSHDIMIYRAGLGVNKNKTIGAQNSYESFVSFGTSGGILEEPPSIDSNPIVYRRILKKDEKAIPVDLIENLGIFYQDGTQENEFLLPPFTFQITNITQKDPFNIYDIEEIEKINPKKLLAKRLDEVEQYLRDKNYTQQYEKLKQMRDRITRKTKKTISGYNIKDIYYSLRPKGKKANKVNDEFNDR